MAVRSFSPAASAVALVLTLFAHAASAQTLTGRETSAESVAGYPLGERMPMDPEVLVGGLENGLRFYVRPNLKPARRAELRLVVRAGSVLEDPDQLGLAHFVEHMLFEGTRNFPGRAINDVLASLGLSIGADANAQTSFDDTQYTLRVPTDVPGALDVALQLLADWAQAPPSIRLPSSASARLCSRVAHAPRRRRPGAGPDPPRAARGIATPTSVRSACPR